MDVTKKKLVISGSSRIQDKISFWKNHFESKGYAVIAIPETWDETQGFKKQLTSLYKDFYRAIDACDVFFLLNEDRGETIGYIGANGTAELIYATMLSIVKNKNIDIYIAKIPDANVLAYDEVINFLKVGWIRVYEM